MGTSEIDVPRFARDPVAMGALVLVPSGEDGAARLPKIAGLLAAPAIARSEIGAAERVTSVVRIRTNAAAPGGLDVITTLKSADGRDVLTNRRQLSGADLAAPAGAAASVELPALSPGEYTVRVEARRGARPVASRELRFSVVP